METTAIEHGIEFFGDTSPLGADMTRELAKLKAELAELRADKARLDSGMIHLWHCRHEEIDLRAAIDRAIEYRKQHPDAAIN